MADSKKTNSEPPVTTAGDVSALDWSDLRVFLFACEMGSISAAAKALGLSQPTASQKIRGLEAVVGAQLLVRKASGISPTDAGRRVWDAARGMQREARSIELSALTPDPEAGRVRLAAPDAMATFWLAPRFDAFRRVHPNISLSVDAGLWQGDPLLDDVELSLQFDDPGALQGNVVHHLCTVHYGVFASREYIQRHGAPQTFEEMSTHAQVRHVALRRQPDTWASDIANLRSREAPVFETNSSGAAALAIRNGVGLGLLPTWLFTLAPDLVMLGEPAASLKFWLTYYRDVKNVPRAARVIAWLQEVYDPATYPWFAHKFIHPRDFK